MNRKILCFMVLYVLGGLIIQNAGITVSSSERVYQKLEQRFTGEMIGEVTGLSKGASSFILYVNIVMETDDTKEQYQYGVACYLKEQSFYAIGQMIKISGEFYKPKVATNAGEFNQYIYYRARGVDWLISEPDIYSVQGEQVTFCSKYINQAKTWLMELRNSISQVYEKLLDNHSCGLVTAMVLGDKSGIADETKRLYQKNNISHLLAISGLHVGLLSGLFYKLLRKIGFSYVLSGMVGMVVTFSYGYMTGNADATLRAAIMLSVSMIAGMLGRTYDMLTAMSVSVLVLCSGNIWKLYDGGFLFSYGAVLGIGGIYPLLHQLFPVKKKIGKTVLLNISITVVTFPIALHFYGTYSPYSIFVNMLVIPPMSILLVVSLLAGVIGLWNLELAGLLLYIPKGILWMYEWICETCLALPGSYVILGTMDQWALVCYVVLLLVVLVICFVAKRREKKGLSISKGVCRGAVLVCVSLMVVLGIYRIPEDSLLMMDVGQGQCVLLETKNGLHIMVDGGSTNRQDVGKYVLLPVLKHQGIQRLDYVVVSHADTDHISGITYLLEQSDNREVEIGSLVLAGCCKDDERYLELENLARKHGVKVIYASSGDGIRSGDFSFTCLYPRMNQQSQDVNDLSLVFLAQCDEKKILLPGDIGMEPEKDLLRYDELLADLDVLLVAHHGSKYSSSEAFLELTKPKWALISCGEGNFYGHPHKELLERLKQVESKRIVTTDYGAVTVKVGKEVEVYGCE